MIDNVFTLLLLVGAIYGLHYWLRPPLDNFPILSGVRIGAEMPSAKHAEALDQLAILQAEIESAPLNRRLQHARDVIDKGMFDLSIDPQALGIEIIETQIGTMDADWIVPPNAEPGERLLFLHGGAFALGSRHSHRALAAWFARECRVTVLIPNYRLMPENSRLDCVEDAVTAYEWMVNNGPNSQATAQRTFVAGDSAGGGLTLTLINLLRDRGLRQVDAAIALSPTTDSSGASPTMRANINSDAMLGPSIGKVALLPHWLGRIGIWLVTRKRPDDPLISPIYNNLADLPPVLVHASESEMLFDDARRWYSKAKSAGSPVRLETWPGLIHVWQLFGDSLPEAVTSIQRIAEFVEAQRATA